MFLLHSLMISLYMNTFLSKILVKKTTQEGWLSGTLNGKQGLIPENYCEKID